MELAKLIPILQKFKKYSGNRLWPAIKCKDGYIVSIQASEFHYCFPRENGLNEYEALEVGYPSENTPEFYPYADGPEETAEVFGYVPIEVIQQVLDSHGGIVSNTLRK